MSGADTDGRSPPSWLPKALAVAAVIALVAYLGLFWTPPELSETGDGGAPTEPGEGTTVQVPQAQFDFEYTSDGRVTVSHQGGQVFSAENTGELYVAVDGERRTAWSLPAEAGDAADVDVDLGADQEVSVIWVAPDGGRSQIVADFQLPAETITRPAASFDFNYASDGRVTVIHQGGDVFSSENTGELYVAVDGERRTEWSLPASAGDQVSADASPGQRVTVVWTPPDAGGRAETVGDYSVPGDSPARSPVQFREAPNGSVVVTYVGREPIFAEDTRQVVVVSDGGVKRVWELPVERGDRIRVPASPGDEIRVFRTGEDDPEDLLGTYEVGADRSERVVPDRAHSADPRPQEP